MAKENVLFVTDHPALPSGVGKKSKEIIGSSLDEINWTCLGGNSNPRKRSIRTYEKDFFEDPNGSGSVNVFPHRQHGNYSLFSRLIEKNDIDKALFFGDPNNFYWLRENKSEIQTPLYYYHVWDNLPVPEFNKGFYECFEWIGAISLTTYYILEEVYSGNYSYVPHGADENTFYPITENLSRVIEWKGRKTTEYQIIKEIKEDWLGDKDFIIFWCNRNLQRKNAADVIRSFHQFTEEFPEARKDDFALLMKTDHEDREGPNLAAVADAIADDCDIRILPEYISDQRLNWYYNIADVTLNIANREGFGLPTEESLLSGTPILVNKTGGLLDQCGFKEENGKFISPQSEKLQKYVNKEISNSGKWVNILKPEVQTLSGTQTEPYIYDDYVSTEEVVNQLKDIFMKGEKARKKAGMKGRTYVMGHLSLEQMTQGVKKGILRN